ncbi:MAG: AAA family ATPase [Candidatus Cloacimonetes bacterium]|nr:AAA family ATPase [Candidatus Cloacimonadota bacterium]MBS3767312.1 AAA family ATPase [Candidatus Cloacimonadota bacterium]
MIKNIHVFGPSGSGTTTLGEILSNEYDLTHFDADDYFWYPTEPPYEKIRPVEERQELLLKDIKLSVSWVISGSITGWGDIFIPYFELVIYLWAPTEIRIKRLKKREYEEFGEELMPGGNMYENHKGFIKWTSKYDFAGTEMVSRRTHELWMNKLKCPLLKIEGIYKVDEIVEVVNNKLRKLEKIN